MEWSVKQSSIAWQLSRACCSLSVPRYRPQVQAIPVTRHVLNAHPDLGLCHVLKLVGRRRVVPVAASDLSISLSLLISSHSSHHTPHAMASARTDPASLSDERYVDVEKGVVGETSTPPPAAVTEAPTLSLTPSRLSTSRLAFALAVFHFFVPPALPPTTQVAETRWQRFLECCGIPLMAFVRWVHTAELVYWLYYP